MYLIIYADDNEKQEINWKFVKKDSIQGYQYHMYLFKNTKIVIVKSGVGIAMVAACAELFIYHFKPQKVFNYGAVGGSDVVNQYDVIIPARIYYHDVITPWYPVGQVPYQPKYYLNAHPQSNNINLATGMTFINSLNQINKIKENINVDIFDMETAAISQVCLKNKIDLVVIKCVSDIIGKTNDDLKNINEYIRIASKKSFMKTQLIIENND